MRLQQKNRRRRDETGVALVLTLVILLILTIIGIASMNTSSFEERMAGNVQESTLAFEAAESGVNKAMTTAGAFVLTSTTQTTFNTFPFSSSISATVTIAPTQMSPPKRGSGYSATSFDAANFDQRSVGKAGNASSTIHRGVAQIVPK